MCQSGQRGDFPQDLAEEVWEVLPTPVFQNDFLDGVGDVVEAVAGLED